MMRKFPKSLLSLMVMAAMPLIAATTDNTIYVTTLTDEDGENTNACSLREAVKAASTHQSYGGCIAGQVAGTNTIQLKAGTYTLTKGPLIVGSNISISGATPTTVNFPDAVNDAYPARIALQTTIQGVLSGPLLDSSASKGSLTLNNLILTGGNNPGNGGAIRSGGALTLTRVNLLNNKAAGSGGAVYLEGANTSLTATDTLIQNNTASHGAVLSMSCIDNVAWTVRSLSFDRSSLVNNTGGQNIIEYCGTPSATISDTTIAQNTVSSSTGSVIQYTHDQANGVYVLHPSSSLSLKSNTIVSNTSPTTLLYDNVGQLSLVDNVLAYNSGLSCRYSAGDYTTLSSTGITGSYNAITKSGADMCQLPVSYYSSHSDNTLDLTGISMASVLYPLQGQADYNGFLPIYLPANGSPLIDKGGTACSTYDQRNLDRHISGSSGSATVSNPNYCDIGSAEVGVLRAADVSAITNTSYVTATNTYQSNVDFYKNVLSASTTPADHIAYYQMQLANEQRNLAEIQNPATTWYRQAYVSVLPSSVEQEQPGSAGTSFIKFLTNDLQFNSAQYTVSATALGRGNADFMTLSAADKVKALAAATNNNDRTYIDTSLANQLDCSWDPVLKQVLVHHKETNPQLGYQTPAGSYEYCSYTITSKATNTSSTGYIQVSFQNIAPIANNQNYTVQYGSTQQVSLDLTGNSNDDGDGKAGIQGFPAQQIPFYKDPVTGRSPNIKITNGKAVYDSTGKVIPGAVRVSGGLGTLYFDYEAPCPDASSTRPSQTCYGGHVTYKADNIFSPFNDSFQYSILDSDLAESNTATVTITNTATTTNDSRTRGGGALGVFGVFGLASLAWLRRRVVR